MKTFMKLMMLVLVFSMVLSACSAPATTVAPEPPAAAATEPPAAAPTEPPAAAATEPPTAVPTEPPATEVPLTANEEWAKQYGLGPYQPETEDWAAVEAAAKLEGKVVVYSNSSRISNIADAWAALYPDIVFEPYDMGTDAEVTKIREEQEAGAFTGDIGMGSGSYFTEEFAPKEYIWKYIPPELLSAIPEANQNPILTHSLETYGWLYNTQLNQSCPISNWWEATDEKWKGKIAVNKDPVTSGSDMAMLTSVAKHADELAAAYQALYGKEWTTDSAYGEDTPDAGWLWMKKLAQSQMIAGSDEAWAVMGSPGMTDNILGLFWYSKYRKVTDGEAFFAPCVGLQPVVGLQKHNYLAILNQAPHPNAAKLYMRFALSADGFKPWNQVGQVSGRTDVPVVEAMEPFKDLPVWSLDEKFVYDNVQAYHDFFALNLLAP